MKNAGQLIHSEWHRASSRTLRPQFWRRQVLELTLREQRCNAALEKGLLITCTGMGVIWMILTGMA
jgi:hypothetical protein